MYQVNYSMRFLDGQFVNQLRHAFAGFNNWHDANEFKELCESGHVFERDNGRYENDHYKCEDVTLTAV